MTFYIRDMNILIFWCPQAILKPIPRRYQGMTVYHQFFEDKTSVLYTLMISLSECVNK